MGFQQAAQLTPAPASEGDFASANPRASFVAPEGGFVAGSGGVTVGRFAWIQPDGKTLLNSGSGVPDGFIHREQQALIQVYLAESGGNIPAGFGVTLMRTGDYFVKSTVAATTKGQKAFAKLADGTMQPANAGATVSGFIETAFVLERACLLNELTVMTL